MTNPKYTTAEYLAWIDEQKKWRCFFYQADEAEFVGCDKCPNCASYDANRDVLVRHESDSQGCCSTCGKYGSVMFPCKTATDITQRLDEVM